MVVALFLNRELVSAVLKVYMLGISRGQEVFHSYILLTMVPGGSNGNEGSNGNKCSNGNKISNDNQSSNGNQWQPKDLKDKTDSNLQNEQNVLFAVFCFICNMAMGLFWS